jgi:multidrug efflux pump subunit AcrB
MKWDGEWHITYETFRDMGIAFAVAMLLIYLLIVGQFQSFLTPLIIMAPIPLTLIGILPGHWLSGSYFTATSMIGFIALAGIIVRNSILLVDFIQLQERAGVPSLDAVIKAGAIRTRPILLTAAALMVGAFVIILDPIFQGLAVSLLFGVGASTVLTLLVIPLLYYLLAGRQPQSGCPTEEMAIGNGEAVTHRPQAEGVPV